MIQCSHGNVTPPCSETPLCVTEPFQIPRALLLQGSSTTRISHWGYVKFLKLIISKMAVWALLNRTGFFSPDEKLLKTVRN